MLTEEQQRMIEDWVSRLEAVARTIMEAAYQNDTAADKMNNAASNFSGAVRNIPTYIRTGS